MTDAELEAALRRAQEIQARTRDGLHELTNLLQIIWGEIDLLKTRARVAIEDFARRYPDIGEP